MLYRAQQIADYLVADAHELGSFLSNLKLQKLLYYVQAWHLAIKDRPLFPEEFQAWIHGPAIPEVYQRFQEYGWRNIDEDVESPSLDRDTEEFLQEVLDEYGPLDARRLEWLTHREDPWIDARKRAGVTEHDEPCSAPIDEDEMKDFYRRRMEQSQAGELVQDVPIGQK
jgi:uncharacterized phage-associated protein